MAGDLTERVLAAVEAGREQGRTLREVVFVLSKAASVDSGEDPATRKRQVAMILSSLSARPTAGTVAAVARHSRQRGKPLLRLLCEQGIGVDGVPLAGHVTYIHHAHLGAMTDQIGEATGGRGVAGDTSPGPAMTLARRCPLCGEQIEEWQLLGGDYSCRRRVALFRRALSLSVCEPCFRSRFYSTLGEEEQHQQEQSSGESIGMAVLPAGFFADERPMPAREMATRLGSRAGPGTQFREDQTVFDPDDSFVVFSQETRNDVLKATVEETRALGAPGGTCQDIIKRVDAALSPRTVHQLSEVVQWSLHMSSSKTLRSLKPLLRRALVGFDGRVQVIFVAKEYIDPAVLDKGSGTRLAAGIRLEIAQQVVPGALWGLGSFTAFAIMFHDLSSPKTSQDGGAPRDDDVSEPAPTLKVTRRYSDFLWLREELVRWYGDEAMVPPLPSKRFVGRFNESFLEARMHALEHFLSIVATHPLLHAAQALQVFFKSKPLEQLMQGYEKKGPQRLDMQRTRRLERHAAVRDNTLMKGGNYTNNRACTSSSSSSSSSSRSNNLNSALLGDKPELENLLLLPPSENACSEWESALDSSEAALIRRVVSRRFHKALRKAYKKMNRISSSNLELASLFEKRALALKKLAAVEMLNAQTESHQNMHVQSNDALSDIHLSEQTLPLAHCSIAQTQLLSCLSQMDVLAGTAHRATCIRTTTVKLQVKEWHRSLQEFSYWLQTRGTTVRMMERSIKAKEGKKSRLDDAPLKEMSIAMDKSRQDALQEARWLAQRDQAEIADAMINFCQIQMSHARQMARMWQDFLPQIVSALDLSTSPDLRPTTKGEKSPEHSNAAAAGISLSSPSFLPLLSSSSSSSYSSALGDTFINVKLEPCDGGIEANADGKEEIDPADIYFGERIGKGSFGEVHEGVYHGRRVAVKTFCAPKTKRALLQFRREATVMRNLPPHPNLISYFGHCSKPERVCLVMELVESGSMLELLLPSTHNKQEAKPSWERLLPNWQIRLALGAARGIHVLHSQSPQVLHRDIKTSNLLVALPQLETKVCDFGLARFKLEEQSVRSFVGTASWVAPEVIMSAQNDRADRDGYTSKADVYSFAIVMWQIFMRRQPYPGMHATQVLYKVTAEGLRPTFDAVVPSMLEQLIKRCWHHDPDQRPNFAEIITTLERLE